MLYKIGRFTKYEQPTKVIWTKTSLEGRDGMTERSPEAAKSPGSYVPINGYSTAGISCFDSVLLVCEIMNR